MRNLPEQQKGGQEFLFSKKGQPHSKENIHLALGYHLIFLFILSYFRRRRTKSFFLKKGGVDFFLTKERGEGFFQKKLGGEDFFRLIK